MRPALPITCSAGWRASSSKATRKRPHRIAAQPDLPLKEIPDIEKKALNRPVTDLARTGEKEVIDVITVIPPITETVERLARKRQWLAIIRPGNGSARQYLHGHHLFRLRQRQSHSRRRVRRLHRMRDKPGMQLTTSPRWLSCNIEIRSLDALGLQGVDVHLIGHASTHGYNSSPAFQLNEQTRRSSDRKRFNRLRNCSLRGPRRWDLRKDFSKAISSRIG